MVLTHSARFPQSKTSDLLFKLLDLKFPSFPFWPIMIDLALVDVEKVQGIGARIPEGAFSKKKIERIVIKRKATKVERSVQDRGSSLQLQGHRRSIDLRLEYIEFG
jgi:hypothetical protein